MWLPLISRIWVGVFARTTDWTTFSAHGPAALTSARALTLVDSPVLTSSTDNTQWSPSRRAVAQRTRGLMLAPRALASTALRITRRASSTQQSEYSNALAKDGLRALPTMSRRRSSVLVGGSIRRPPRWS